MPWPEAFGYLIMISFLSCAVGGIFYSIFSFKIRGHLLPFHTYRSNIKQSGLLTASGKKTYGTTDV